MATIASDLTSSTSSGFISGSGLAHANIIGFLAMDLTMSFVNTSLAERPKNTSAFFIASASVLNFVSLA